MLGNVFKRLVNLVVLGLASVTFFLVPIGRRTPFQHAVAVFSSPSAHEAGAAIADAGHRVATSVRAEVDKLTSKKPAPPDSRP